jgi:hypothetical protein
MQVKAPSSPPVEYAGSPAQAKAPSVPPVESPATDNIDDMIDDEFNDAISRIS